MNTNTLRRLTALTPQRFTPRDWLAIVGIGAALVIPTVAAIAALML